VRCVGEQFVSYPQLSLHFRQHPGNVTVPRADLTVQLAGFGEFGLQGVFVRSVQILAVAA
jgi:hypothetical protein